MQPAQCMVKKRLAALAEVIFALYPVPPAAVSADKGIFARFALRRNIHGLFNKRP